jgi:outer membrane protein
MSTENQKPENSTENQADIPAKSKISNGTIINVVLFVGLIILFVVNFFPGSAQQEVAQEEEMAQLAERIADGTLNIAFVKSDSLMANYKLAIKMREDFEGEQRRMESDLQRRQRSFQTELETFQRQIQTGAVSMENAQRKEQELMQLRDDLMQLNDTYTNRLMTKEVEMNTELYGKITELLDRYSNEAGYDYILGFSSGGGILYASSQHDITDIVIRKLNSEYDAGK